MGAFVVAVLLTYVIVQFRYVMPVVLFSLYLLYGMIRPWISHRMRTEIEVESQPDEEPDTAEAPTPEESGTDG